MIRDKTRVNSFVNLAVIQLEKIYGELLLTRHWKAWEITLNAKSTTIGDN